MARKKKQEPLQHDWTMPEVLDVLSKENEGYRLLAAWYRDEPVFIDLMNHYGLSNQETLSAQMALREFREKMERYEGYGHDQLKDVVTYGFESTDTWLKQTRREADRYHETGDGHNARSIPRRDTEDSLHRHGKSARTTRKNGRSGAQQRSG